MPSPNKLRVMVAYHFLPNYRKGIFDEINREYDAIFYGEDSASYEGIPVVKLELPYKFRAIKNYRLGSFWFQPVILKDSILSEYDVFIFLANPNFVTTWLAAFVARLRGKRVVFWGHGFKDEKRSILNYFKRVYFGMASAVYFYGYNSKRIAKSLGMPECMLYVGYNSLDYKSQLPLRLYLIDIIDDKLSDERLNICCISRLTKSCNYELLFKAIRLAHEKNGLMARVTIIGYGPEYNSLVQSANFNGVDVDFLGAIYDEEIISSHIYNSDVTISPGKIGLTAIHSLMFGTPVISHNYIKYQMPEFEAIIEGRTGMLFVKDDVESLAEVLCRFKSEFSDRSVTRANCFSMVDNIYNPDNQMTILKAAIEDLPPGEGDDANKLF